MQTILRYSSARLCIFFLVLGLAACGDSKQSPSNTTNPPPNPNVTDADNDGVADSLDQCPGTPANTTVDAIGCPVSSPSPNDADSDGVSDANDACPNTPAATMVNADGCSAKLCQAVVSGAVSQCFDTVASKVKGCYLEDGEPCYDDNAVTAALQTQQDLIQTQCGSDATVQEASYGDLLTLTNLQLLQEDACLGNVQSLAARSFGGPHAKLLENNAGNPANTACLEAVYDQGQTIITSTYNDYDACINDDECADFNDFTTPDQAGRDNTANATLSATCAGNMSETQGSTPDIFIARANAQARCMIAETNGDTSAAMLDCGPDNALFENLDIRQNRVVESPAQSKAREESNDTNRGDRLVVEPGTQLTDIDNLPRGVGLYVEMDSNDWGTVCGDGSPYAVVLRLSADDAMLDNAILHQQGGGVCLAGTGDCVTRPQHLFEAIDHAEADIQNRGYLAVRNDNPFQDWSVMFQPYCNQDLHIGGGGLEAGGRPENDGQLRRSGSINIRQSTRLYRDLIWRMRRHTTTTGYRSNQPKIVYSGTSAGGYGVQYNLHHPLDEMRWENTLGSPHVAFTVGGGTTDLSLLFTTVGNTWMTRSFQPPYCLEDNCSLTEFNHPAHGERLGAVPFQQILNTSPQHDNVQEPTQGYPGPAPTFPGSGFEEKDWIIEHRRVYCDIKDTPNVYFHMGANTFASHDFLNTNQPFSYSNNTTRQHLVDGMGMLNLLYSMTQFPDEAIDRVEEGPTLPGVTDYTCDLTPANAAGDFDGDGINNQTDICFGTPAGQTVALNGCPVLADDADMDGIVDDQDQCPNTATADTANEFGCSLPQSDPDGDGLLDPDDNCPSTSNPDQTNLDTDFFGDACDTDLDGDGVANNSDNCPNQANADQLDINNNDVGDVCEFMAPASRPTVVPACYQPNLLVAPDMSLHECTWNHFAHDLQRDLDADTPMVESLWLASHNSYNYPDQAHPASVDPNQVVTITDQLNLEMRTIELDIHWAESPRCSGELQAIVCHSQTDHSTCFGSEHTPDVFFDEIRIWMDNNPDEVIQLDLEARLSVATNPTRVCPGPAPSLDSGDGSETVADLLEEAFGDLIYTTTDSGESNLPFSVTRREIFDANRRIVVASEQQDSYSNNTWLELVHSLASDSVRRQKANEGDGFNAHPDCEGTFYSENQYRTLWTRMWEDTTNVGRTSNKVPFDSEQIQEMLKCGMNNPSFDQLRSSDIRLAAMVWSWAETEPAINDEANCALHNTDGRFESADCAASYAYACANADNSGWVITAATGDWSNGAAACTAVNKQFATPQTGYFNQLLRQAKTTAGATEVWLNYAEDATTEGIWTLP